MYTTETILKNLRKIIELCKTFEKILSRIITSRLKVNIQKKFKKLLRKLLTMSVWVKYWENWTKKRNPSTKRLLLKNNLLSFPGGGWGKGRSEANHYLFKNEKTKFFFNKKPGG